MSDEAEAEALARTADRLDELASTADLMGDDDGALRFRRQAERARLDAMRLIDG